MNNFSKSKFSRKKYDSGCLSLRILLKLLHNNLTLYGYTIQTFQGCIFIFDGLGACFLGQDFFGPPGI